MSFALVSLNDVHFQPLANLTWEQNKVVYAELHGYSHACKTDGFYGVTPGYEKIFFIRDLMEAYPDIEWFWWSGCDAMVTNFTTKLEDVVDNDYHFIIATDVHGINADSFFVRNSTEGRGYIDYIVSQFDTYNRHEYIEQQCMKDSYKQFESIIKIVPQRLINAYDYGLYPEHADDHNDTLGFDGQWASGDLLIHWPGTNIQKRLELANFYMTQVIK
jgi:hypothetical protein